MVIYLTGATGLLGNEVAAAATRRGHEVVAVGFTRRPGGRHGERVMQIDLRDENRAIASILDCFPDIIINAAAISDAAACEKKPEDTARVNTHLPTVLARLSHHVSARLIHVSTDMVYDGKKGTYAPEDLPNPTSSYGEQKLRGERNVLEFAPEFSTIVRTTLLTGNSPGGDRSVHEKLFQLWASGKQARLFEDEFRQPCHAANLADVLVEIAERTDLIGLYHWTGGETLSRWEIGEKIRQRFKLPPDLTVKTSLKADPAFANRPADLTLNASDLTGKLKTRPLPFAEQLETFHLPKPVRDWYNNL